jgi:hypothetical protein
VSGIFMSITFNFFDSKIIVTGNRERYNSIRSVYSNLASKLSDEFVQIYKEHNHNLDDVSKNAYGQGSDCISVAMNFTMKSLVELGIYDLDLEMFIYNHYLPYHVWDDHFNTINDRFMEIVLNEEQLDAYRRDRRESRGRLIGGGFGIQGAAKGIVTAGAVNLAAGAVHGIFNGIGKIISSVSAQSKKDKIFRDPATLQTLSQGVCRAVFNIHHALIDVIYDQTNSNNYEYVSKEDSEKAKRIFNNIRIHEIESSKEINLLNDIIQLNPYNKEYYEYIIAKYGDEQGDIEKISSYFGVDIISYKKELLKNFHDQLEFSSEKIAAKSKQEIIKQSKFLKVENSAEYINSIDNILLEFDKKARTFEGILFETREEADWAKKVKNDLDNMINGYEQMDEERLLIVLNRIEEYDFKAFTHKEKYLQKINERLKIIDIKARIFDGVEYNTREEVLIVKNQNAELMSICSGYENVSEEKLLLLKNKVSNTDYMSQIIEKFISLIDSRINQFEAKRELQKIEEIWASVDTNNYNSIMTAIDTISKYSTIDKRNYIISLEKRKHEIDIERKKVIKEKLGFAIKYEEKRKKSGFFMRIFMYLLGIGFSLFLIGWLNIIGLVLVLLGYIGHFANLAEMRKYKKAWRELTNNGQQPLPSNK